MTNKMALAVAVILGVLSVVGIRTYVEQIRKEQRHSEEVIPVLVATRDLDENSLFTDQDAELANFPREFLDNAFRNTYLRENDKPAVVGARTVGKVKAGQVLIRSQFLGSGGKSKGLKFQNHERAMTIPVGFVAGVGGMLRPGDYIDIVVSMGLSDPRTGQMKQMTRTLFEGKLILACGENTDPHRKVAYNSLTMRFTPAESNKMIFCLTQGAQLHCLLTNEGTKPSGRTNPVVGQTLWNEVQGDLQDALRRR